MSARYWAVACLLLLTGAAHHHQTARYTHKPGTLGAGVAAVSLEGPCIDYGYRVSPHDAGALASLDAEGLFPGRSAYKQLRETAVYDCAPARFNILGGELFNQHLDQDSADPFIAATYSVQDGPWRISLGGGFLYARYGNKPVKPAVHFHFGPGIFPFFSVQFSTRF